MSSIRRDSGELKKSIMNLCGFDLEGYTMKIDGNLPSRGLHYKSKFINFRGLRFKEKLALSKIGDRTGDAEALRVIMEAMRDAIKIEDLSIEDMIFDDFYLMFFWVSFLTDEDYALSFGYNCDCGEENSYEVKGSSGELEMSDLSTDKFVKLKTSIGEITLVPPTVKNMIDFMSGDFEFSDYLRDCVFIKRLNGSLLSIDKRVEVMEMMEIVDVEKLRDAVSGFKSRLKPLSRKCGGCGKEISLKLFVDLKKALP